MELRLKLLNRLLSALFLLSLLFFLMIAGTSSVWGAESDFGFERAAQLSDQKRYDEELLVLTEGLKQAEKSQEIRMAFFLARDLSICHENLGDLNACLEVAEKAIGLLDRLEQLDPPSMIPAIRAYERTLLTGLMTKRHLQGNRLALARHWYEREGEALRRMFALLGTPNLDFKSGDIPQQFIWVNHKPNRSQIARHLWMGAWLLELEARTDEALANLEAAELYLSRLEGSLNEKEIDYQNKIRNRKALVLDFLGYDQEAIAIHRELASATTGASHAKSRWIAHSNLQRILAGYFGPTESHLAELLLAHQALKELSSTGKSLETQRQIHKMIFDLRHDATVAADLRALEKTCRDSGFQMEGDYGEIDQIKIAFRLGQTDGLEARLIAALEKARNLGNRKGVPSRYRDYGDLLMMLGRPGEAIYMYRETLNLSVSYGWIVHVPDLMLLLAEAHLDLGDPAGATEWLRKAQNHLQANPKIPAHRVARARATMVSLLRKLDRGNEADALREETLAFVKNQAVPSHQIRHLIDETLSPTKPSPVVTLVKKLEVGGMDFQPLRVLSEVAPGETAHVRYTLANLTGNHVSGELRLPTGIELVSWDSTHGNMCLRTSDKPQAAKTIPVNFAPSEMIRIFVESSQVRGLTPQEFSFEWDHAGAVRQTSHWSFSAADSNTELTVVNTNQIRHNPFYLVPLYHAIRARDLSQAPRDFRVRSSIPCYVEMLDAATDQLIAVDSHGNGSFREPGDIVFIDQNGDLYPDHLFKKSGEIFGLELRVVPLDTEAVAKGDGYTIAIEGLIDGKWETLAENQVVNSKAK